MIRISRQALFTFTLGLLFIFGIGTPQAHAQYDDTYVSYDDFYQNLAPYGQWIEDPQYGYVWSPNEGGDFRPYYTNGHWVMTEYGNTWVSDYNWGWAPFHYGRWTYDNYYGWLWIPGSTWGPAWVSWRSGNGYYGWAPLGPGYQLGGYTDYSCPNDWWVFIPPQYVYTGNYYHYWTGPRGNSRIMGTTTFINNTYASNNVVYVSGPHAAQVQQVTGQPVRTYHVRNSSNLNTRVHNDVVRMYRPAQVNPASPRGGRPTPPDVVSAPQPIRQPQAVNTGQSGAAPFRSTLPNRTRDNFTPGTNVSETAQPTQSTPRNNTRPYEWDAASRPTPQQSNVPRSQPRQQAPQQQQPQAPVRQAPQQQQPQQPIPQQQAPVRQAPAPQQQSNPAPAQAPRGGGGGRR